MPSRRFLALSTLLLAGGCAEPVPDVDVARVPPVLIVGQDLASIRGYLDSGCCPAPDGLTAYLSFYDLVSEVRGYGGLGLDASGTPVDLEHSWGAGPVNAYRTATAFGVPDLAIGLDLNSGDRLGTMDRLVAGEYEANVDQLLRLFRHVRGTVYLRIGYEFDGNWNSDYRDPVRYVAAFRYLVDRVRAGDAENVRFVWQASASPLDDVGEERHEDIASWYPGDDYVDWLAFSWFLPPDARPSTGIRYKPPTPLELAEEVLALARNAGKPVMVAEAAPQGFDLAKSTRRFIGAHWDGLASDGLRRYDDHAIWETWYAPLFALLHDNRDVVRALAYINCHWDAQPMWGPPYRAGYWGDSRLEANASLARRFTHAVALWKARS